MREFFGSIAFTVDVKVWHVVAVWAVGVFIYAGTLLDDHDHSGDDTLASLLAGLIWPWWLLGWIWDFVQLAATSIARRVRHWMGGA